MRRLSLVLCFGLLLSSAVYADEGGGRRGQRGFGGHVMVLPGVLDNGFQPKFGPCAELKLEASQKTKLKEAYFKFKEADIDLESRIKKAHLKYEEVVTDLESEVAAAKIASQEIVSAVSSKMLAHENYKNEVTFEILKPQQRSVAHACMMAMSRFKQHGREKHGEHERHKMSGDRKTSKAEVKAQATGDSEN